MTIAQTRDIAAEVDALYAHLVKRAARPDEIDRWVHIAKREQLDFKALFDRMLQNPEYKNYKVIPEHAPGHHYSPIVNPEEIKSFHKVDRRIPLENLRGMDISEDTIHSTFEQISPFIAKSKFPEHQTDGFRFYHDNKIYPRGDAVVLSAMISWLKPSKIFEVGSGFSTACMLDTIEREGLSTRVTCVEPFPTRLRQNLTPADHMRVSIHESFVQVTDPEMYAALEPNDILFIDSTHVVKTGSDVCFELFEILPRLKPGVFVHFHDIQYPFEYPDVWVFNLRRSWNENYALRAFLMYNDRFEVMYFNSYFGGLHRDKLEAAYGGPISNPGSGIWMRVRDV